MRIEVTDEAAEVLRRSLELGGVDDGRGGIRVRAARGLGGGVDVQVELADAPSAGETELERAGIRLFVDPAVADAYPDAVLALEPQHDTVVLRPARGEGGG